MLLISPPSMRIESPIIAFVADETMKASSLVILRLATAADAGFLENLRHRLVNARVVVRPE